MLLRMKAVPLILLLFIWTGSLIHTAVDCTRDDRPETWRKIAEDELKRALNMKKIEKRPKNVVFFLGDGMGITTLTASRIYKGQQHNKPGEEGSLVFEQFPHVGLVKTYNTDKQVPDSAGTATAFFCGEKTASGVIGLNSNAKLGDCSSVAGNEIDSILQWAQEAGKATGLVTTTRVTHATPAGLYAHTPHRDWEYDSAVPTEDRGCKDIARQLVENKTGNNIRVIFGGGRGWFLPNINGSHGRRGDGRNLIDQWRANRVQQQQGSRSFYVSNYAEMEALDATKTDYALGLFHDNHMEFEIKRNKTSTPREPSLSEMTQKAIDILKQHKDGFFLAVEGGKIDHAHHDGHAKQALHETIAFDEAITAALSRINIDETLIVVTADHSHTLTMAGYPDRGVSIVGFGGVAHKNDSEDDISHTDPGTHLPYTTLGYANGPGGGLWFTRGNLSALVAPHDITPEHADFKQDAAIRLEWETHGGEDVAIYAQGPFAHLFHTLHEQNYIPIALDYAACYRKRNPMPAHCAGCSLVLSSIVNGVCAAILATRLRQVL